MQNEWKMTRRGFVSALVAGIAGCNTADEPEPPNPGGPDGTATETGTPPDTSTPSPQLEAGKEGMSIEWTPDIHQREEFPEEHTAEFTVNQDGDFEVEQFELWKVGEEQDEQIASSTSGEFSLTAAELPDGENQIYAKTRNGEEEHSSEPVSFDKDVPEGYRADIKRIENEEARNVGFNTIYGFDDHQVDLEVIEEWHNNDQEEFLNQEFIQQVENNDLRNEPSAPYPNIPDDPWTTERGHFELSEFKEAETFGEALSWIQPAWIQYSNRISDADENMAISMEYAIENINENGLETKMWGHNVEGLTGKRHGMILGVNENNRDLWIIDTVSQNFHRADESPFGDEEADEYKRYAHPIFHFDERDELDELSYSRMKRSTSTMFNQMITMDIEPVFSNADTTGESAITDNWIESALEPMKNGKMPVEIENQLKEYTSTAADTLSSTILAGSIDDPHIYTGPELGDIAEQIDTRPETYTVEDIEAELAG